MMARLIVCVLLLGISTFSCVEATAKPTRSDAAGYSVVAAGYSSVGDNLEQTASRAFPSSQLLESYDDAACMNCRGIGCRLPCAAAGCPGACNVWTEEDFFHVGQFFVQGWLDQGFTWNPADPDNRFNTPLTFNDRANEYQMNQLYLAMGRHVNKGSTWDVGGRVDLLYGTDYFFTTAAGLETYSNGRQRWNLDDGPRAGGNAALYGLAMPQLYAEFYAPWRYGTTVKVGHFYTILGYESVMAPKNFFYSHSYVKQYGEPFTHTGFLVSQQYGRRLTLHAGMTRGWDSWEDPSDRPAFLGGISWTSRSNRTNVNFAVHTGDEHVQGESNRTAYSLVLQQQLNCRWGYVFQHDFGVQHNGASNDQEALEPAYWYSINQYLFYDMSPTTSLGFRFEWFRDENNARVLGITIPQLVTGKNYYEATLGFNWHPSPRFVLRPEVRWDWSDVTPPNAGGMYNDFLDKNQFTLAADLIFVF